MFGVVLGETARLDAAAFAELLSQQGIQSRPFFAGMHGQPVFRRQGLFDGEEYPVADRLARRGLYLPSGIGLTEGQIDRVCEALRESML